MHVEKFKASALGHMLRHYDRSGTANREEKNIDPGKSYLNYNLAPGRNMTQIEYLHKRMQNVKVAKRRDDIVMMYDVIIALPKGFEGDQKLFFKVAYDDLCRKAGGEANVISAYVHYDEPAAQPHLHFAAIPITRDERLCAKEVVSRKFLKSLHKDMQADLNEAGLDCQIVSDVTMSMRNEDNLTPAQLKIRDLKHECQALEKQQKELQKQAEALKCLLIDLNGTVEDRQAAVQKKAAFGRVRLSGKEYSALLHVLDEVRDQNRLIEHYKKLLKVKDTELAEARKFHSLSTNEANIQAQHELCKIQDLINSNKELKTVFNKYLERVRINPGTADNTDDAFDERK